MACPIEENVEFVEVRTAKPCGGVPGRISHACIACEVKIPLTGRVVPTPDGKNLQRIYPCMVGLSSFPIFDRVVGTKLSPFRIQLGRYKF
jgi:hypothetical protein